MSLFLKTAAVALCAFGLGGLLPAFTESKTALEQHHQAALTRVRQAAEQLQDGRRERAEALLKEAAGDVRSMAEGLLLSAEQRENIESLARQLETTSLEAFPSLDELVRRLAALKNTLEAAGRLRFFGAYSPPAVLDHPSGGGHASAAGPPPKPVSSVEDLENLPPSALQLDLEAIDAVSGKTYSGGPSKEHILESGGAGVALIDYDNDGLLDIFLVNAYQLTPDRRKIPRTHLLYRNLGNWTFQDISEEAGVNIPSWGYGVCAGDYDGDGLLDLYVTNFGPNFLFRNNGDGTFTESAAQAGVDHSGWSTGCAFFDADQNGSLDLYVANYLETSWEDVLFSRRSLIWRGGPLVMTGPTGMEPSLDVFYRNQGNGRLVDDSSLFSARPAFGFGVLVSDYDNDGRLDVYVANDSQPNYLFFNREGRFVESGLSAGAALSMDGTVQAGMGVDAADLSGQGLMDLIVTNFARDVNTLYRNLGGGIFQDTTQARGLHQRTFQRLGWGVAFFDADLDGDLDLFIANGHLYPQVDDHPELNESFRQRNQLFLNHNGRFLDVSDRAGEGLLVQGSSRGLAVGDLDNDGRLDLVITNLEEPPTILRNRSPSNHHWILLEARKESGKNRFCIGARVTVRAGDRQLTREIRSGGSYLSQNDLRVHFGLGNWAGPVDVVVEVPGEGRWEQRELPVDRLSVLELP